MGRYAPWKHLLCEPSLRTEKVIHFSDTFFYPKWKVVTRDKSDESHKYQWHEKCVFLCLALIWLINFGFPSFLSPLPMYYLNSSGLHPCIPALPFQTGSLVWCWQGVVGMAAFPAPTWRDLSWVCLRFCLPCREDGVLVRTETFKTSCHFFFKS